MSCGAFSNVTKANRGSVSESRQSEFREALEDSPIVLIMKMILRQTVGWPLYLFTNATGQVHYPAGTNREQKSPRRIWELTFHQTLPPRRSSSSLANGLRS